MNSVGSLLAHLSVFFPHFFKDIPRKLFFFVFPILIHGNVEN